MGADRRDPLILLDVTRLLSRLGQGPLTGIDRVEAAWLTWLQARRHLLLARVHGRQMLLPPAAGRRLIDWLRPDGPDVPPADWIARLRGKTAPRHRGQQALAGIALARHGPGGRGLRRAVRRAALHSDPGDECRQVAYVNVGHSNLTAPLWRNLGWATRVALIHDTIPLDHPDLTRAGQSEAFQSRLCAVLDHADLVLTVSRSTAKDVARWAAHLGRVPPPMIAAPIGVTLAAPDPAALPADLDLTGPFFIVLGTIEPRKNHALLLDVWDRLARQMPPHALPRLLVVGRRGWENHATFARLDRLSPGAPVIELSGLPDGAVAALMERAHALLMPSRAEGFGLPLAEAAGRGTPVLAAPLPAARELLGARALWLPADDPDPWAEAVAAIAAAPRRRLGPLAVPSWSAHLEIALAGIRGQRGRVCT